MGLKINPDREGKLQVNTETRRFVPRIFCPDTERDRRGNQAGEVRLGQDAFRARKGGRHAAGDFNTPPHRNPISIAMFPLIGDTNAKPRRSEAAR